MPFIARLLAAAILAVPFTANACWEAVTLEEFVKDKPLIVVGEIQRIDDHPAVFTQHTTAYIKIDRVLHVAPPHAPKAGGEIPLTMPSPRRPQKWSTDIAYKQGARGVWILYHNDGKYTAGYPMSLQPSAKEADVVAAIKANVTKS